MGTQQSINRVVGYVRCSTEEQADSGLGLNAQRAAILEEVARKGWDLVEIIEDPGYSAKTLDRPGMSRVRSLLRSGKVDALMVSKLDRATRSTVDAANLLMASQAEGWSLIALDLGLDPTTPTGELVATLMAAIAQWERRAIGQRTKDALAAKRARGVRLGRPVALGADLSQWILTAHQGGMGWSAIARNLNERSIATAHGGSKWYPSTVRSVVTRLGNTNLPSKGKT
jgi:DNA invertase Pin-like site-specific DNA recombinase